VDDEGAGGGSAFDGVDAGHGFGVESVRSETVHGFGGKATRRPARRGRAGGVGDFAGVGGWGIADCRLHEVGFWIREAHGSTRIFGDSSVAVLTGSLPSFARFGPFGLLRAGSRGRPVPTRASAMLAKLLFLVVFLFPALSTTRLLVTENAPGTLLAWMPAIVCPSGGPLRLRA